MGLPMSVSGGLHSQGLKEPFRSPHIDQRLHYPVVSPAKVLHSCSQTSAWRPLGPLGETAPPCRRPGSASRQRAHGEPLALHWPGTCGARHFTLHGAPHFSVTDTSVFPTVSDVVHSFPVGDTQKLRGETVRPSSHPARPAKPVFTPGSAPEPVPFPSTALPCCTEDRGRGAETHAVSCSPSTHFTARRLLDQRPQAQFSPFSVVKISGTRGTTYSAQSTPMCLCLRGRLGGSPLREGGRPQTSSEQSHRRVRKCPKQPTSAWSPPTPGAPRPSDWGDFRKPHTLLSSGFPWGSSARSEEAGFQPAPAGPPGPPAFLHKGHRSSGEQLLPVTFLPGFRSSSLPCAFSLGAVTASEFCATPRIPTPCPRLVDTP